MNVLFFRLSYTTIFLIFSIAITFAASREEERINSSVDVLNNIMVTPEKSIPLGLLKRAKGIAIIPGMIKGGLGVGGRYGKGVMVVRMDNGCWSYPVFVSLAGGSIGYQIGGEQVNMALVFMSRESAENAAKKKITLGADASVTAGPIGRQAGAGTDIKLRAEILTYAQTKGLFAGVALEGAQFSMDKNSNKAFYKTDASPEDIFTGKLKNVPPLAKIFVQNISMVSNNRTEPDSCFKRQEQIR
jgi:lipid-binding SYLF domain-containing protein